MLTAVVAAIPAARAPVAFAPTLQRRHRRTREFGHFFSRAYDAAPRPCRVASRAHGLFASLVEASACLSFSATLSCCRRRTGQRQRPCDGSRKVVSGAGEPPRRAALMRVVPRPRGGHTSREMMPRQPSPNVIAQPLGASLRRRRERGSGIQGRSIPLIPSVRARVMIRIR